MISESSPQACPECLRRSRLLAHLAPYIEKIATGAPGSRSPELLRLCNEDLAAVVAPQVAAQILAADRRGAGGSACVPSSPRRSAGPAAGTTRSSRWGCATPPTRPGR